MPPKFFITHSWKDIEFARRLCDDLHAHGLDGFFDERSIRPGESIPSRIERGLVECDYYLPAFSPDALLSPWCEWEIDMAIMMNRTRGGRPHIIPVLAEKCDLPFRLQHLLYVSFIGRYNDAFHELLTKGFGVPVALPVSKNVPPTPPKIVVPPSRMRIFLPRTKTGKDGKEMILIPAGEFVMGSNNGGDNEKPPHTVYLDAFYIARYPVTNAEYKNFWTNWEIPQGKENHPVVNVTWKNAVAYCKWAGARLPTEAEWEKAASWDDAKKSKRVYPWGDTFDKNKCNSYEPGIWDISPVGKYSPQGDSAYGVGDMVRNVSEWCADWYDANFYGNSPARNPQGPDSGTARVLRGGSFYGNEVSACCAFRSYNNPDDRLITVGFRVAESFPT